MRIPRVVARAVARAKPHVPADLWPLLLTVRSFRGDGPLVGLPAFRRVLVLAAHPDDETVGCGGTLALLADGGATITALFASDGDATRGTPHSPAETARRRRAEAARAGEVLGFSARSLGLPDTHLNEHLEAIRSGIEAVVAETDPEVVFVPWFLDGHPDHRAVSDALAGADVGDLEVWGYETWTALPPNRLVDVTTVIDRKREALAAHETAFLAFDVSSTIELGRWRSAQGLLGRGYAEAFLAMPAPRYSELSAKVRAT
jgi:LmbE family N-acetylglucosaminyl deacetylase